jgi:hypothetical protein
MGKKFHIDHFFCSQCGMNFGDKNFLENEGQAYCEPCFNDMWSKKCAKCKEILSGPCINAIGKTFHENCFCCKVILDQLFHFIQSNSNRFVV